MDITWRRPPLRPMAGDITTTARGTMPTAIWIPMRMGGATHEGHRSLADILDILNASGLSPAVRERASAIFGVIAAAEAQVHGKSIDEVHFHEVGALDSIIDIVGAAICIDRLAPDRITAAPPELGSGTVHCAHGIFPIPAPATARILVGVPVHMGGTNIEATTPTGAAILKAQVQEFTTHVAGIPQRIGTGIGHAEGRLPNILRAFLIDSDEVTTGASTAGQLIELSANIDDMSPELLAPALSRLLEAGALDAWLTPIVMKKGRVATMLTALGAPGHSDALENIFFAETTTLGVRRTPVSRSALARESLIIQSPLGPVQAKASRGRGRIRIKAECDELLRIAREEGLPLPDVQRIVESAIHQHISSLPPQGTP